MIKSCLKLLSIALWTVTLCAETIVEIQDQCTLEILTPSLQERKTAKIRLENGLEAYLISDPKADQSAAALSMEVGSWNDPEEYPGMAHFLEHLLFLGSEAYPEENGYEKQILDNAGQYNAYTASDRTVYSFTVNHDAFLPTFDMFSHMFTDPLFTPSGIGRELHAVDQEHDKNIENDGHRLWMVLKETGNPSHPNSRFSTGNAETLGGIPQKEVKRWHQENYSADKAHLILYSTLPLEELKRITRESFSPLKKSSATSSLSAQKLFSESQEGHLIAIEPVKEQRQLTIWWELPPEIAANLEEGETHLVGEVLHRTHEKSLLHSLKSEGLITQISTGKVSLSKEAALFAISFELTPTGTKNYDRVIERCFAALSTLKSTGIPSYIAEEKRALQEIGYAYQSRLSPFWFVTNHADQMVDEPIETYPQKTYLPSQETAGSLPDFLNSLSPNRAVYLLLAPSTFTGIEPEKTEKWSKVRYATRKIPPSKLQAWSEVAPDPEIKVPSKNPFIPKNLELHHQAIAEKAESVIPEPKKLISSELGTLYLWEDSEYLIPETIAIFNFHSPLIGHTPKETACLSLFCYALDEKLLDTLSYAEAASLRFLSSIRNHTLRFTIQGYSEKTALLIQEVLEKAKQCTITKEAFDLYKTALKSHFARQHQAMPMQQALEKTNHLLFNNSHLSLEIAQAFEALSLEEYNRFASKLFKKAFVEVMIAGNILEQEALTTWEVAMKTLSPKPYPPSQHEKRKILTLSPNEGPYKVPLQTDRLGHAAILMIQQGKMTFPKKASQLILGTALQEDFFDTLRTKQQTGYMTNASSHEEEGQLYMLFKVQSSTHQPDELIARFELFLEGYIKDFETAIPEGRFEVIRSNLITQLETAPTNLSEMATIQNSYAFDYQEDFKRCEKIVASLRSLSYEAFKTDTHAFISRQNSRRIAVELSGVQPEGKEFRYETISSQAIKAHGNYLPSPFTRLEPPLEERRGQ